MICMTRLHDVRGCDRASYDTQRKQEQKRKAAKYETSVAKEWSFGYTMDDIVCSISWLSFNSLTIKKFYIQHQFECSKLKLKMYIFFHSFSFSTCFHSKLDQFCGSLLTEKQNSRLNAVRNPFSKYEVLKKQTAARAGEEAKMTRQCF